MPLLSYFRKKRVKGTGSLEKKNSPTSNQSLPSISTPFSVECRVEESGGIGIPVGRTGHTVTKIKDNQLLLLGGRQLGNSSRSDTIDCYLFILQTNERVDGSTGYSGEWKLIETLGHSPSRRWGHACVMINDRRLFLYGGVDHEVSYGDAYFLDIKTFTWTTAETKNSPHYRSFHSLTLVPSTNDNLKPAILLYGGRSSSSPSSSSHYSDVHTLNIDNLIWTKHKFTSSVPSPRAQHSVVMAHDFLYIIGGYDGVNQLGDVHRLHLPSYTWSAVDTSPTSIPHTSGLQPPAFRYPPSHRPAISIGSSIYLLGNIDREGMEDEIELHMLNLKTNHWSRVPIHYWKDGKKALIQVGYWNECLSECAGCLWMIGGRERSENVIRIRRFEGLEQCLIFSTTPAPTRSLHLSSLVKLSSDLAFALQPLPYPSSPLSTPSIFPTFLNRTSSNSYSNSAPINPQIPFTDMQFVLKRRSFNAHKCILYARSDFFRAMLSYSSPDNTASYNFSHLISSSLFPFILNYLYTSSINSSLLTNEHLWKLLLAADSISLFTLKRWCAEFVANSLTVESAIQYYLLALWHDIPIIKYHALRHMRGNISLRSNPIELEAERTWLDTMHKYSPDDLKVWKPSSTVFSSSLLQHKSYKQLNADQTAQLHHDLIHSAYVETLLSSERLRLIASSNSYEDEYFGIYTSTPAVSDDLLLTALSHDMTRLLTADLSSFPDQRLISSDGVHFFLHKIVLHSRNAMHLIGEDNVDGKSELSSIISNSSIAGLDDEKDVDLYNDTIPTVRVHEGNSVLLALIHYIYTGRVFHDGDKSEEEDNYIGNVGDFASSTSSFSGSSVSSSQSRRERGGKATLSSNHIYPTVKVLLASIEKELTGRDSRELSDDDSDISLEDDDSSLIGYSPKFTQLQNSFNSDYISSLISAAKKYHQSDLIIHIQYELMQHLTSFNAILFLYLLSPPLNTVLNLLFDASLDVLSNGWLNVIQLSTRGKKVWYSALNADEGRVQQYWKDRKKYEI